MNPQESIIRILKSIGKTVSNKLHCDRHGSCVHFAEIFVEEVNNQYPELLYDFDVIEGYVKVKFGNGIPQEHTWIRLNNGDIIDPTFLQFNKYDSNAEYSKKRTKVYSGQEYYDEGKGGSWFSERRKKLPSTVFKEGKKESIRRILIKETEKLNPFVLRRIDLDKFESLLNKGSVYMFYESNSLEEFKWKLVTANLENYIYFKYDIEIDLNDSEYDNVIEYLVNLYSNKLESMYNNLRKERGLTEEMKEGEFVEKWSEKYKKSINCNNPKVLLGKGEL